MKVLKEWTIEAPWGNLALISWGNPRGPPVLLVHGRQDSAATYIPLLELLPDSYHYVGVDMPGNGRSDAFPPGVKVTRFHFIAAVEVVIEHLKWQHFVFVGHSMGCEHGLFYNAAYPGRITKMIFLDLGPSLQRLQVHDAVEFYEDYYAQYYDNYHRDNFEARVYTKQRATEAVMRARGLTRPQADIILSRNLIRVADDTYRLSWDYRLRNPAPQNYPVDYYIELFTKNSPPTLLLSATNVTSNPYTKGKEEAAKILENLQRNLKNFTIITVEGGHDVHFTNPERLAKDVKDFLEKKFGIHKVESCDHKEFMAYAVDSKEFLLSKL